MKQIVVIACALLLLAGCKERQGQNVYAESEMGISRAVEYGTVVKVREVTVPTPNSGRGQLLGAGVGAGAGSYVGKGDGNALATVGAAVAGAVAGYYAEQAIWERKALVYTVRLQSEETKDFKQEIHDDDVVFKPGDLVMVEYCDGGNDHRQKCKVNDAYQRVLPVDKLPPYVIRKRKVIK